jgi:hypothetical protein
MIGHRLRNTISNKQGKEKEEKKKKRLEHVDTTLKQAFHTASTALITRMTLWSEAVDDPNKQLHRRREEGSGGRTEQGRKGIVQKKERLVEGALPTALMKLASSRTRATLVPRLASADARFSSALRRALATSFCAFSIALARLSSSFLCSS